MATTEKNRPGPLKHQALLKIPLKRLMRGTNTDATPIKKRVMAALNLSCKNIPQSSLISTAACGYQVSKATNRMEATPDVSPGLKHTLAQFSLSSQSSLGGPAAFLGQRGQYKMALPVAQGGKGARPLLVPPDSSTDLGFCCLEGESIFCFSVGGELRLCLPQLLNTVLRDFSLQQINSVCDQLYVYCSLCNAAQLHVLKVLGVLPPGTPSCGLITLTDAQRLCNTLLSPDEELSQEPHKVHSSGEKEESEESGGFWVEHQCLGKCEGLFVPQRYSGPDAPCIRCALCRKLFCPERFVMHSHRQPDKCTCHWGFDSAKWTCYLQLSYRHLGGADEEKLQLSLMDMKSKFQQQKRQTHLGVSSPAVVFDSHLFAGVEKKGSRADLMCLSWYQYVSDKPVGNSVAGHPGEDTEKGPDKHTDSQDGDNTDSKTPTCSGQEKLSVQSDSGSPEACKRSAGAEHSEDRLVLELLQMYRVQHEKLQSTLHRQKELGKQLQEELEAVQTEQAQKMWEVQQEHRELKSRLEQLRQHDCRCKDLVTETHQETIYSRQVSELQQRLDRAEEEREELQEELRRETEARERLKCTISDLKQQIKESVPASLDSPVSLASSDT